MYKLPSMKLYRDYGCEMDFKSRVKLWRTFRLEYLFFYIGIVIVVTFLNVLYSLAVPLLQFYGRCRPVPVASWSNEYSSWRICFLYIWKVLTFTTQFYKYNSWKNNVNLHSLFNYIILDLISSSHWVYPAMLQTHIWKLTRKCSWWRIVLYFWPR